MADGSITDDQVHIWLQGIVDNGFISLHFDSPALGGLNANEIAGGGYRRYKMAWTQPQNRHIWSAQDAKFTGLQQTKVTYFGVWDALNLGMLRAYGELPDPAVILTGGGYVLHEKDIAISMG